VGAIKALRIASVSALQAALKAAIHVTRLPRDRNCGPAVGWNGSVLTVAITGLDVLATDRKKSA
jgi:hypothetical protein